MSSTKVVIGPVRFSYAHVWEPSAMNEDAPKKYSVAVLIPKSDKASIAKVNAAIEVAKTEGTIKLGGKIPPNLKVPLRDGDLDRPDDEVYQGHFFMNCNSTNKPGILDKDKNEILDKSEFYSGCYGFVSVNFYAFNTSGSKGIGAGLGNLMKTADGDKLSGGASAIEDFGNIDVADDLM